MTNDELELGLLETAEDIDLFADERVEAETTTTEIVMNQDNLDLIEILPYRRSLRPGQVKKLREQLELGEHWDVPLMANKVNGKFRLLDGNHRYEALVQFLEKHDDGEVEVTIIHYNGLDKEDERRKFIKWNLGTRPSINDHVELYWPKLKVAQLMEDEFPAPVRAQSSSKAFTFKDIVIPYLERDKTIPSGTYRADEFIDAAMQLDEDDYKALREMTKDIVAAFGAPNSKLPAYRQLFLYVVCRIWLRNHRKYAQSTMRSAFRKLKSNSVPATLKANLGSATAKNIPLAYGTAINVINSGRSSSLFF